MEVNNLLRAIYKALDKAIMEESKKNGKSNR